MANKTTIGSIALDVLLKEQVTESVQTTEHPVETGTDPTDHVRVMPIRLVLEGLFTNTPIPNADRRGERAEAPRTTTRLGYAQTKYGELLKLKSGSAQTITTPSRKYLNMQMTDISRLRDASLGTDTVQFSAQFKEIVFVNTDKVQLERKQAAPANPKKAAKKAKLEKQTPESSGSILKGITDFTSLTSRGSGT